MNDSEPLPQRICRLLADGQPHSGATLATQCAVSRNAVWKAIASLREAGLTIEASAQHGYRRVHAGELLDDALVRALLPPSVAVRLRDGQCVWRTKSTNQDLLARAPCPAGSFDFLTAECQTQGRGRRARRWMAPPCGAVCLSISWSFAALPADASALSLAVGVCVMRALRRLQVPGVALKWPNDLVVGERKLAGILIELRAEAGGPAYVVIGIGMNVALGEVVQRQIEDTGTQAVDLAGLCAGPVDRNRVVAELIASIVQGMEQYPTDGFNAFAAEWRAVDALAGKPVVVRGDNGQVTGHARGIDTDGALCVQTREGVQRFVSGDVSVRVTS